MYKDPKCSIILPCGDSKGRVGLDDSVLQRKGFRGLLQAVLPPLVWSWSGFFFLKEPQPVGSMMGPRFSLLPLMDVDVVGSLVSEFR